MRGLVGIEEMSERLDLQQGATRNGNGDGEHVGGSRGDVGKADGQIDDDSTQYHLQDGQPQSKMREGEPACIGEVYPTQEDRNGVVERESGGTNERCRQDTPRDDMAIEHIEPYARDNKQHLRRKERSATEKERAEKRLLQGLVLIINAQENKVGQLRTQDRQLPLPTRVQERQGGT